MLIQALNESTKMWMKAPKCGGKFSKNFSTPRVVSEWTCVSNHKQQRFTWKTRKGKSREISL